MATVAANFSEDEDSIGTARSRLTFLVNDTTRYLRKALVDTLWISPKSSYALIVIRTGK
jgi:hypothetical protein